MRKSRTETVAENRDAFLAGKSEEYVQSFNQKTLDQQYAAIANWKRSAKDLAKSSKDLAKATAVTVVGYLKDAHKKLQKLEQLTPKEAAKLQEMLDSFKDTINNFDRVKKQQYLEYLKTQKQRLEKEGEGLSKKIEDLQKELG